ncbi:MAG: GNAT family N-acetyltransferase [Stappiaceae bacterium]
MSEETAFRMRILSSLSEISEESWDGLANPGCQGSRKHNGAPQSGLTPPYNPFLSHKFLLALEESGSAVPETGWYGQHLILENENGQALGAVPCYLKNHSQGEYVFDHGWADAFERAGGRYYPKLQISVPFTPATGRRLLLSPTLNEQAGTAAMASGIIQLTEKIGASSAHLTFLTEPEWKALGEFDYLLRKDQQFHWENDGYQQFDDFLDALASRKRKAIRKERRAALADDIEIELLTGSDIQEQHWDAFFEFYQDTGSRKWGRPYLNRVFFSLLGERMADDVLLIMAKREGRYIAGALNMIGSATLYGRYWGCNEDHPYLHFEVCYYQAIDFAIAKGLKRVEAGAQGAHKLARGYMPTETYSAHWVAHEGLRHAVDRYLFGERAAVSMEANALRQHAPFKQS